MKRRSFLAGAAALPFGPVRAATAMGGGSFTHDGGEFRLVDVLAPAGPEPYAAESGAALQRILGRGRLDLQDKLESDRWGRRVVAAAVETLEGVQSVQELLLREGAARVRPESRDRAFIARLFAAESAARESSLGLWGRPAYAVRDAATHRAAGAFDLVEGAAVAASIRKGRAYLNFGADYRTDVTATANSSDARRWKKEGLDWSGLAGVRLRIRGYVAWINGPSIEVTHPMQIERLSAEALRIESLEPLGQRVKYY